MKTYRLVIENHPSWGYVIVETGDRRIARKWARKFAVRFVVVRS